MAADTVLYLKAFFLTIANYNVILFLLGFLTKSIFDRSRQVLQIHASVHSRMSDAVFQCHNNLLLFMQEASRSIYRFKQYETSRTDDLLQRWEDSLSKALTYHNDYRTEFGRYSLFYPSELKPIYDEVNLLYRHITKSNPTKAFTTSSVNELINRYSNTARDCVGVEKFESSFAAYRVVAQTWMNLFFATPRLILLSCDRLNWNKTEKTG